MLKNKHVLLIVAGALFLIFVYGIVHLFILRFERGNMYPPYSSYRTDPLGSKIYYEALHNLDNILNVKGPDIVFIGPYDLSQSLGVTGDIEHPMVIKKTKEIVKACIDQGIAVGNFTESPAQTAFWTRQGLRYMSFSVDMGMMYNAAKDLVANLHQTSK